MIIHELKPEHHAWVHVIEGKVGLNGRLLAAGDGAGLSGESRVDLTGKGAAQVLVFDLV